MFDFSVFLNYAAQLVFVAVVAEALTEIVKNNLPESLYSRINADTKKLIAFLISAACFAVAPLKPFPEPLPNAFANLVAIVVVSRGSNCVHDFLKLIRQAVENLQQK